MALAEQREKHRIGERRIDYRGSGGDEQGIGGRIKFTEGMEEGHEEHGARNAIIGEKGSCFQLSSKADGSLEEYKLQKTVRMLEERMEEMKVESVCWKEIQMEKKRRRLRRMEDIRRIGGGDNGGWWFRALLIKENRVSECAVQAENFQDGEADAESGRKERR